MAFQEHILEECVISSPTFSRISETVESIRARSSQAPAVGVILGSGLGAFTESFEERTVIPFSDLPHFPASTAPGHPGNVIIGRIESVPIIALQGRVHLYEGYSIQETGFPVRVLGLLGIRELIVTNAAGGINMSFHPGDLMLITDHINLMGDNPLIGPNMDEFGARFPDMSDAYDASMRDKALAAALEAGITLRQGVYVGLRGPSYETPAEIRMCRTLGADAVGMSTVPEVIVANHMGVKVLGISCITNMAAGILPQKLTHKEVMDTTERVNGTFQRLLKTIIPRIVSA